MFLRIHARRMWSDQSSSHVQRPWTWHWDWRKHTRILVFGVKISSSLIENLSLVFVMEFKDFRRPYFQLNVVFDFFTFIRFLLMEFTPLPLTGKGFFLFWQRKCTSFVVCYFSHRHNTEQGFHRECCVHIHNLPNHVSRGLHARVILAGYAQVILVRYAQARGLASFLFAFSPSACFVVRHRI